MAYRAAEYEDLDGVQTERRGRFTKLVLGLILIALLGFIAVSTDNSANTVISLCPMPPKHKVIEVQKVDYILHDSTFRNESAAVLANSLKIDTVVFDEMTMDQYAKFAKFHEYLKQMFPLVHKHARVHKPNTYGLVFEFKGSDAEQKPIMLCAHQDTVPIGDPNDWARDPWSGEYDGKKIYGRGAGDVKNLLIGLLESMEMLLKDGKTDFKRGVLLAFGFDEEKSGFDGARHIARFLESYLGHDSVEFIIDEGMNMWQEQNGDYYGLVMTGEKGYIDLHTQVNTPGGHSSVPQDHTSIGMLSSFLASYESEMYEPVLTDDNPLLRNYECVAEHGYLPNDVVRAIRTATTSAQSKQFLVNYIIAQENKPLTYLIKTSQAIDIVAGGDKANTLPRDVSAIINHRIAYGNDDLTIKKKATKHAKMIAAKFGIGLTAFDEVIIPQTPAGNMVLSVFAEYLQPAPISPVGDHVWNTIAGSMRAFYEDHVFPEKLHDKKYVVTPSLMTPNTDTRHYWNLTRHIYKATPGDVDLMNTGIHSHEEWITVDSHLQVVAFYYDFVSKHCLQ